MITLDRSAIEEIAFGPGDYTTLKHKVVRHSPTGLSWGYNGSGPSDTALNILLAAGLPAKVADRWYIDLRNDIVSKIPWNSDKEYVLKGEVIFNWIARNVPEVKFINHGRRYDD